jgi:hypothetical protein
MRCVDCKPGAPCWRHAGKTPYVDNPVWEEYLPRDKDGNVVLDLTGAVQVALLESPQYQQQLETLYLSGLDVTFERFRFDSQFFGGTSVFYIAEGAQRAGKAGGNSILQVNPSRPDNRYRIEKFTATGGELVVGFANSLMWQFAGPDNYSSRSILDFSLVQPLLRRGGRARVMERLTISERSLLANVRQMEHYQRGFYLDVVTGRDAGQGPSRRGGLLGGSGLEGFSGVGVGGFGRVGGLGGNQQNQAFGFTGGAGAQQAGGYIGHLQQAQVIRNQYSNIAGLGDSLEQLQAANDAGRIDRFQVDLARQALYNAQSQLLNNENAYADQLDNFKLQFGLPPMLEVKIADPLLEHFNLLDPDLSALQIRITDALTVLREGSLASTPEGVPEQGLLLPNQPVPPQPVLQDADLGAIIAQSGELLRASRARFAAAQLDLSRLQDALPARREFLKQLSIRKETQEANIDPELVSVERLDSRFEETKREYDLLSEQLAAIWAELEGLTSETTLPSEELRAKLTSALNKLSGGMLELSLLQARARLDAISFEPVDLTDKEAYCIASRYRRDWMNARASVVDAWRLIQFNANFLESDLDFIFEGELANQNENEPFSLSGKNGRLRVGLQYDPPLTRLAERNAYRQSLIEYQQSKRQYYQFRDRVQRDLRATLRQMQLDALNLELRRAAVFTAITQVDLARLRLSEPARPVSATLPGQIAQPGGQSQFGDTVARDLVNALIDLLNVQNDFLSVWVDHEVQELSLDFLLGTMELDGRGVRIVHDQPLRTFLTQLPCTAPHEEPEPCGLMDCEGVSLGEGQTYDSNSGVDTEELPRPSPQVRPMDGPSLNGPPITPPQADLLPPPMPPNAETMQ